MKTIVLLAALVAASASPSFAQSPEPAPKQAGVVDILIERADTLRCAVIRDDLPDEALLSGCDDQQEPAR
jgi:hypothetical protein